MTTPSSASILRSRSTPWLDVAHRAVHVDVAGRDRAVAGRCPWRRAGRRRRPRTAAPWPGRDPWTAPGGRGAPCGGTRRAPARSTRARSPRSASAARPGGRGRSRARPRPPSGPPRRPRRCRSSMTRPTDHSLPGMGWALMTTTSSSPMRSHLFSPGRHEREGRHGLALGAGRDHADLARRHAVDRPRCRSATPSGMLRMPSRAPSSTFLPIERPRVATLRPLATAASMTCWTRWMWLAKQATTMRRPAWAAKTRRSVDAHRGLRLGEAGLLGVGRVRQQEADALGAGQRADAGQVGAPAVHRLQVELEVARVQDHALGRVEGDGEGLGHRVGDRDELDVARPDLQPLAVAPPR